MENRMPFDMPLPPAGGNAPGSMPPPPPAGGNVPGSMPPPPPAGGNVPGNMPPPPTGGNAPGMMPPPPPVGGNAPGSMPPPPPTSTPMADAMKIPAFPPVRLVQRGERLYWLIGDDSRGWDGTCWVTL